MCKSSATCHVPRGSNGQLCHVVPMDISVSCCDIFSSVCHLGSLPCDGVRFCLLVLNVSIFFFMAYWLVLASLLLRLN